MRPMDSWPQSIGAAMETVCPHAGPSSYTQIVEGVAPALATGGDTVEAIEGGLKLINFVIGGLTDSAKYRVECIPTTASGVIASPNVQGQPATTYRLRWVVVATGAEVAGAVNLAAEIVRLRMLGIK